MLLHAGHPSMMSSDYQNCDILDLQSLFILRGFRLPCYCLWESFYDQCLPTVKLPEAQHSCFPFIVYL